MVETGSYFSTGGKIGEGADGECESPGALRRGLRSTSYRRAVVSGIDSEAPLVDPKAHRLSQPDLEVPDGDTMAFILNTSSVTNSGSTKPASPGTPKPSSPGTPKSSSPGTPKSLSPGTPKLASPRSLMPASPGKIKVCKHV